MAKLTLEEVNATQKIIEQMKEFDYFGVALNVIQDSAEMNLPKKRFKQFLAASNKDYEACEGQDGILLNGEYFDWKQFTRRKDDIIAAFCRYFSEEELEKIYAFQETLRKVYNGSLKPLVDKEW